MPQTLSELLPNPSKEALLEKLLKAAKGIGFTSHSGFSTGTVTVQGTPVLESSLRIRVSTAGSLGSAAVEISADGGSSYSTPEAVPGDGIIALTDLGVELVLADGATTADSFLEDDVFSLELNPSGLAVTSWQPGSVPLTLLELDAQVMEDAHQLVGAIAAGGFLETSTGPWLTLLAANVYQLARTLGRVTRGQVHLVDTTGDGPYSLTDGQLTFTDVNGLRFVSSGTATLPASGAVSVDVVAERVGAQYNLANATITTMVTVLPGVSCSNIPIGSTGTWITSSGRNEETDAELRERCRERWPAMGIGATASGYDLWAKTASAGVTRTMVRASATVPGQVEVFCAGPNGAPSGDGTGDPPEDEVAAVDDYIQPRVPLTCTAVVAAAPEAPYTVTATVYVEAAFAVAAQAEALASLSAYDSSIAIGGTIYRSKIYSALDSPAGVRNVTLSAPASDTVLGADEVAKLTASITWVEV